MGRPRPSNAIHGRLLSVWCLVLGAGAGGRVLVPRAECWCRGLGAGAGGQVLAATGDCDCSVSTEHPQKGSDDFGIELAGTAAEQFGDGVG